MHILIEGPDFSGKTTAIEFLKKQEFTKNFEFIRFPHAFIREHLLDPKKHVNPVVMPFYFLTEMIDVLTDKKDENLIIDRGFLSTFVYQIHRSNVLTLSQQTLLLTTVIEFLPKPELVVVVTTSLEEAKERKRRKQQEFGVPDRFEAASWEVWENRKEIYLSLTGKELEAFCNKIVFVDNTGKSEQDFVCEISNLVWESISLRVL